MLFVYCTSFFRSFLTVVIVSAVYNAVGLAAYELFDNVDFDQWFKNQLLGELQVNHHRYCVRSATHFSAYLFYYASTPVKTPGYNS